MDIRARCCYVNARKAFQTCPARIDTALFHLQNDAETDKLVYSAKNRRNATKYVREFLLKKIKLTRPDANKVIGLYWEEKDEDARVEKEEEEEKENPVIIKKRVVRKKSAELVYKYYTGGATTIETRPCIYCNGVIRDNTTHLTREKKWSNSWCSESCHRTWYYFGKQNPY
jgi:hypothetical protein